MSAVKFVGAPEQPKGPLDTVIEFPFSKEDGKKSGKYFDKSVYSRDHIPFKNTSRSTRDIFRFNNVMGCPEILKSLESHATAILSFTGIVLNSFGDTAYALYETLDSRPESLESLELPPKNLRQGEYRYLISYVLNLFGIMNSPFSITLVEAENKWVLTYFDIYPANFLLGYDAGKDRFKPISDFLQWCDNLVSAREIGDWIENEITN